MRFLEEMGMSDSRWVTPDGSGGFYVSLPNIHYKRNLDHAATKQAALEMLQESLDRVLYEKSTLESQIKTVKRS